MEMIENVLYSAISLPLHRSVNMMVIVQRC